MTVCERINEIEEDEEGGIFFLFSLRDWIVLGALLLIVIGVWRRR